MKRGVKKSKGRTTDFHHVLLTGIVALVVIFSLVVIFTYGGTTELDDGVYVVEEGNIVDEGGNLVGEASFRRSRSRSRIMVVRDPSAAQQISALRGRYLARISYLEGQLAACPVPECSTPIDDDGDGFINQDDPGCDSPEDTCELNCPGYLDEDIDYRSQLGSSDDDDEEGRGGGSSMGGGSPPPDLCGNGILDAGEGCDDGNNVDGDGCSAVCQPEGDAGADDKKCGNGIVEPPEECDPSDNMDEWEDKYPHCSSECTYQDY